MPSTVSPVLSSPPWRQPQPAYPRSQNQNRVRDQEPYYEEESWEKRAPGAGAAAAAGDAVGAGTVTTTISSPLSPRRPAPAVPAGVGGVGVGGSGAGAAGGGDQSSGFEFRGFDFFAKKDFNELRDASRAYFNNLNVGRPSSFISFGGASSAAAKRNSSKGANGGTAAGNSGSDGNGASWLGDATPPPSPTLEPKRAAGAVPPLSSDGGGLDGDEKAKGRGARAVGVAAVGAGGVAGVGAAAGGGRGAADGDGGEGGGLADGMFPEPDESEPRIFGLRKRMFWVLVALLGAVLLVIIIAVSVGVSMGKKNGGGDDGADNLSAVTPTASSSPQIGTPGATTVTATETTPASTVTTTATKEEDGKHSWTPTPKPMPGGSAKVDCPAANDLPGSRLR